MRGHQDLLQTISMIPCGAVSLRVSRMGGLASGEDAIVFLHGFPELARFWTPVMSILSDQFSCIAPDQRGYGGSQRPLDPNDYRVEALIQDIIGLLDQLGLQRCHLVGHDWGGVLAWWIAARHPQRVNRLAVFNAPHPAALQARLLADPQQQQASAYLSRLQQPGAAD